MSRVECIIVDTVDEFGGSLTTKTQGHSMGKSLTESIQAWPDIQWVWVDLWGVESVNREFIDEFLSVFYAGGANDKRKLKFTRLNDCQEGIITDSLHVLGVKLSSVQVQEVVWCDHCVSGNPANVEETLCRECDGFLCDECIQSGCECNVRAECIERWEKY